MTLRKLGLASAALALVAAPIALQAEPLARAAAPVDRESELGNGPMGTATIIGFLALVGAVIFVVADSDDDEDDLPVSP